jgi:uncharacterized cupredoxin-like copper-binding protein
VIRLILSVCLVAAAIATLGCAASGAGGREVQVAQGDDGCTPLVIEATPGEKLDLRVKNETGNTYEVEGIDGTNLEEVLVPEGRTRSVGYRVPDSGGVGKVKCYTPGGVSTIIEIRAGDGTTSTDAGDSGGRDVTEAPDADATVTVSLVEYEVLPDVRSVEAGTVLFKATNDSGSLVHELAILRVESDGSLETLGEIEDLDFGAEGAIVVDLEPGRYQLACLLIPGEAGSETDHYQEGMWTEFTAE